MGRPATCTCDTCPKCQHKLYMRSWYRKSRRIYVKAERRREYEAQRWHQDPTYRQRHTARMRLSAQVRRGIQVPTPCALCGAPDVIGHHNDYDKPLEGTWLCRVCHDMVHGPLPAEVTS
jgi:hypothetical protein